MFCDSVQQECFGVKVEQQTEQVDEAMEIENPEEK